MLFVTNEFLLGRTVDEEDTRDVEHVTQVLVGEVRLVGINFRSLPVVPRQLQRDRLDREDSTCSVTSSRMHAEFLTHGFA